MKANTETKRPIKRRRGRPPGSKNKPKPEDSKTLVKKVMEEMDQRFKQRPSDKVAIEPCPDCSGKGYVLINPPNGTATQQCPRCAGAGKRMQGVVAAAAAAPRGPTPAPVSVLWCDIVMAKIAEIEREIGKRLGRGSAEVSRLIELARTGVEVSQLYIEKAKRHLMMS